MERHLSSRADPDVFTVSVHGRKNFPFRKQQSKLDIELEDETEDDEYLSAIERALAGVWRFSPDFILYQSGVDGLHSDRLGRLRLTAEGLRHRDETVLERSVAAWHSTCYYTWGRILRPDWPYCRSSQQHFSRCFESL